MQEYVRDAGVADPHAVAEQCRRMGVSLVDLREMAGRLGAEREIATACGCSLDEAECIIRHEDTIHQGVSAGCRRPLRHDVQRTE